MSEGWACTIIGEFYSFLMIHKKEVRVCLKTIKGM